MVVKESLNCTVTNCADMFISTCQVVRLNKVEGRIKSPRSLFMRRESTGGSFGSCSSWGRGPPGAKRREGGGKGEPRGGNAINAPLDPLVATQVKYSILMA